MHVPFCKWIRCLVGWLVVDTEIKISEDGIQAEHQFSVPWIAYLCSTRWHSNLQGNASWVYGRHDPPYVYCQQGELIGSREMMMFFLEILKRFRHG